MRMQRSASKCTAGIAMKLSGALSREGYWSAGASISTAYPLDFAGLSRPLNRQLAMDVLARRKGNVKILRVKSQGENDP